MKNNSCLLSNFKVYKWLSVFEVQCVVFVFIKVFLGIFSKMQRKPSLLFYFKVIMSLWREMLK